MMPQVGHRVTQLYDQVAETPTVLNDGTGFWNFGYWTKETTTRQQASENLIERLLQFIPRKVGTILDVACGTGETSRYLLRYYRPENVTAIDINEKQLALCRQRHPECNFMHMSATELHFPSAHFDNVICVEAAFHFETRERFLAEAFRVLKPGGRLVLSDLVLASRSQMQPPENFVPSLQDYKSLCYDVGFNDVMVIDASYECAFSFARYGIRYATEQLRRGEINPGFYRTQVAWIASSGRRPYLLVCCERGRSG